MPTSQLLALLLPSLADLWAFAGSVFATAVLALLGGGVAPASVRLEVRLFAGWGIACLVLTLWGIAVPWSMELPAWALVGAAMATLAAPGMRPGSSDLAALGRLVVLALPLLAIIITVRPALPDTFLNLLPNAAFLVDHAALPDRDAVATISIFPALPYNQQLEVFLASLITPGLPAGGLVHFNVFAQLAFALLLARLLTPEASQGPPGWVALAFGLALTTLANPGFMPKVALASMGEPTTEVTLALAAWLGLRALDAWAERRSAARELWLMSAVLLAFINIRQSNVALFGSLAGGLGLLALADPRVQTLRAWRHLGLAMLPAALFYALWRIYVFGHFHESELKLLPLSEWQSDAIPEILASMGSIILHRSFLFVCLIAAGPLGFLLWRRRREWSEGSRALALVLITFLAFNAFLVFTYVAHFGDDDGRQAHSYFRYNSHLSLLMMLALTLGAREFYRAYPIRLRPGVSPWAARLAVAVTLLAPLIFLKKVRFDLAMPQPVLWDLAKRFAERLRDGDQVALIAPGDNGTVLLNLRGYLALTAPRRSELAFTLVSEGGAKALAELPARGIEKAIVTCAARIGLASDGPEAVMLEHGAGGWTITARSPYTIGLGRDWMAQFPTEPFCDRQQSTVAPSS
ncbi:MAG: hypothetical protein HYR63_05740 [Proteobacteria bacterium]|nr:hypothetical protein [Pseudomonadota bacterium]MBI3495800.1 hypothetical protein [Pseudomonadota bacterium]